MTKYDIIRMAREAGFLVDNALFLEAVSLFERFAALVAANEREACAKVCDEFEWYGEDPAAAIRARGEK